MQILVTNYCKTLKKNTVLDHVNLELKSGVVYGLSGQNGSGKTMLLRALSGLILPTAGAILVDGKVIKRPPLPITTGLLLENPAFLENYTGRENLLMLSRSQNSIEETEVCNAMKAVGLSPDDPRKYRKYSMGMKQRLGIACAIMGDPELVLLDEPTNSLDETAAELLKPILVRLRNKKRIIVVSSHDKHFLQEVADVIIKIDNGKVSESAQWQSKRLDCSC